MQLHLTNKYEKSDIDYRFRAIEALYANVYSDIIKLENKIRDEREKIKELRSASPCN